jgi:hypothetical protein
MRVRLRSCRRTCQCRRSSRRAPVSCLSRVAPPARGVSNSKNIANCANLRPGTLTWVALAHRFLHAPSTERE